MCDNPNDGAGVRGTRKVWEYQQRYMCPQPRKPIHIVTISPTISQGE